MHEVARYRWKLMGTCRLARLVALEGWKDDFVEIMNDWRYKVEWREADEQLVRHEVRCRMFDDVCTLIE